jgi:hypothetical protein
MHAHDSLFVHCETYPLFHYYEPHALFVIMSITLSLLLLCVHALCFTIQTLYSYSLQIMLSNSIFLFFANHAFFKYLESINMKFHHSSLHN